MRQRQRQELQGHDRARQPAARRSQGNLEGVDPDSEGAKRSRRQLLRHQQLKQHSPPGSRQTARRGLLGAGGGCDERGGPARPDEQNDDLRARHPRYESRLRELMVVRKNWYTPTKLIPELRKYGYELDPSSMYRLVSTERPPRMPNELILALCEILDCRFEDLVVQIEPQRARRGATAATIARDGGAEVKAAAKVALDGILAGLRDFLQTGQYKARERDENTAAHIATVNHDIALAATPPPKPPSPPSTPGLRPTPRSKPPTPPPRPSTAPGPTPPEPPTTPERPERPPPEPAPARHRSNTPHGKAAPANATPSEPSPPPPPPNAAPPATTSAPSDDTYRIFLAKQLNEIKLRNVSPEQNTSSGDVAGLDQSAVGGSLSDERYEALRGIGYTGSKRFTWQEALDFAARGLWPQAEVCYALGGTVDQCRPGGAGKMLKAAGEAGKLAQKAAKAVDWLDDTARANVKAKLKDFGDGIPNRKDGTRWFDPKKPKGNTVRIEKGNPSSPFPSQQVDHVRAAEDGNW
ncbi:XRE family transcriptional regulator [Amycolatopsis sp. AA4]|uniref:helix-turn-helix domain-containing protein n=1 Tax=Actinomycetes TaxID=1760 RepID=UPI00099757D5|nr:MULTISPECIES: helix-turn-helix transcriptional regulator [Actinomycetes]ATY13788.1 XRE family transcriptional regulator [Amycolatopsis sp. AA4]